MSNTNQPTETPDKPLTRDQLRAQILGQKPKTELVSLFGATVEIRQPSLKRIMNMRQMDEDVKATIFLTEFTFVPGTDDLLFDDADQDALLELPFSADFQAFIEKMNGLMGLEAQEVNKSVEDAVKTDSE